MTTKPFCVSWESTLRCNLECSHCGLSAGPCSQNARGKELSTNEALVMLRDLVEFGVTHLILSGGEFLTRQDAHGLLEVSLALFPKVRLISNGMMGMCHLDELCGIGDLTLSLSLDGSEHVHDAIRCRRGSFWRVIDVLKKRFPPIEKTVISTITRRNIGELNALFDIVRANKVRTWSIQIGLPAGRMLRQDFLSEEELHTLAQTIARFQNQVGDTMEIIPDDCFGYGATMRAKFPWMGCPAGKDLMCILSNGDITACPTLHESFGNVRDGNVFEEVWNGEALCAFRNNVPQCSICCNQVCHGGCRTVDALFGRQFCF